MWLKRSGTASARPENFIALYILSIGLSVRLEAAVLQVIWMFARQDGERMEVEATQLTR